MIQQLQIQGFKIFKEHVFGLCPISVLAGTNGAGKTSVVHALLLAREAWYRKDNVVELNGPFGLELGGFEDVLNHETIGSFAIGLTTDEGVEERWVFSEGETELYAVVEQPALDNGSAFDSAPRSFQYLSAERMGPRITQGSAALPPDLLEIGCRGEYCNQILEILGKMVVEESRRCPTDSDTPPLLKDQTELWLSRVTRSLQIDTESFAGTGLVAMRLRTGEDWVKPTNMGFGVTYALPVILAGLTASRGGVLIIENPEAHLHPAGQSQMGIFLSTMAAAGVQIIVETHSDHILNGIRRAIGERRLLPSSSAIVHYFDPRTTSPQHLSFTEGGGISQWPAGFFDQYQMDVAALTRVRRAR